MVVKHVFAISAYGQSPYLEECIVSLEQQSLPGEVFICTSTPSDFLKGLAGQHGLPLFVREGTPSLRADWNFCVETARGAGAELLTIAHQDDVYLPDYAASVRGAAVPGASLIFTAAENIDSLGRPVSDKAEKIKRILRWPLSAGLGTTPFGRRLTLAFGNPVPCPACTYNLNYVNQNGELFGNDYRFVIDWKALGDLAEKDGSFVYIKNPGVRIRLHEGQETRRLSQDNIRQREELEMFRRYHSRPAAELLMCFYRKAGTPDAGETGKRN